MNLLFWNLNRKSNEQYIVDIMTENNIDIGIFSEYQGIDLQLLENMFKGEYNNYDGEGGCKRITLFARNSCKVSIYDTSRYAIYTIKIADIVYNIAGIHLPANPHYTADDRKSEIRDIVSDVINIEGEGKNNNTIVIGDFKVN